MNRFITYLKETRAELKHVTWPSQKEATVYTALVIGISLFVALFVGVFDYIFSHALDWFIS